MGKLSYGAAMVQTAAKVAATRVLVQVDDEPERHLTVVNLCIANGRFFGGGMKIAPDAKLTDGKLDVVSIGNLSAAKILASTPRLYAGKHLGMAEVGHTLAKKVFAQSLEKERVAIEVDGELPGYLPATFQIVPSALRIRCR